MGDKKHVAVIGAGSGGLIALKSLLEDGHDACAFDQAPEIGGFWNYGAKGINKNYENIENPEKYFFQSYQSLTTNTSKYNTCFSDLPPSDTTNDFMTPQETASYLNSYAKKFDLWKYIKLNSEVTKLHKAHGKWTVSYTSNDEQLQETFDHILIATGGFGFPKYPKIYAQRNDFNGLIIHSSQVRNDKELFKNKRILFIGGGNSGAELATIAVSNSASKVFVSATHMPKQKNVWTLDRFISTPDGGKQCYDHQFTRQNSIESSEFVRIFADFLFPLHKTSSYATLNYPGDVIGVSHVNILKNALEEGVIQCVNTISGLKENDVYLDDGQVLHDVDVIVMATGYNPRFPFLDHLWTKEEQAACELYNYTVPTHPQLDGLGFIQMQNVIGSVLMIGELQARWYSACIVPRDYNEDNIIFNDVERKQMIDEVNLIKNIIPKGFPYNYVFNAQGVAERFAKEIGCLPPDAKKLMMSSEKSDVELGVALLYGPYTVAQYRIAGTGAWEGAKETCIKSSKYVMGDKFKELVDKAQLAGKQ